MSPVTVRLLDAFSPGNITQMVTLPIQFPSSNILPIDFYVTHLHSLSNCYIRAKEPLIKDGNMVYLCYIRAFRLIDWP